MKKLIGVYAVLFFSAGMLNAEDNLFSQLWDNVKQTMFKSATAASFYSIRNSEWQAGVISPIVKIQMAKTIPLQFDYGYSHSINAGYTRGTALLGGSIHFDESPVVKELVSGFVGDKEFGFLNMLSLGFYTGYNFDRLDFDSNGNPDYGSGIEFGLYTGITWKF